MKCKLFLITLFYFTIQFAYSQQGKGLNFDGSNDYIAVPHQSIYNFGLGDLTFEALIKLNGNQPNYAGIVCKGNVNGFPVGAQLCVVNNRIAAEMANGSTLLGVGNGLQGSTNLNDGQWHHVALVIRRSNNSVSIFVDGVRQVYFVNNVISTMNVTIANELLIGTERTKALYFNGEIDEVRVWNSARSDQQIQLSSYCELQGNESGLITYYKLNQGIGNGSNSGQNQAIDASTMNISGALTNFNLNGTFSNWTSSSPIQTGITIPAVPTGATTIQYTQGDIPSVLSASSTSSLRWYTQATGGIGSTAAPTPSTATPGSTTYWVAAFNANGCESERLAITVNVNGLPATHLKFDGIDDTVQLGGNIAIANSSFTIETWFLSLPGVTNRNRLITIGNGSAGNYSATGISIDNTGLIEYFFYGDDASYASNVYGDGLWHHIAFTFNSGTKKGQLYLDGIKVSEKTFGPSANLISNQQARISGPTWANGEPFRGSVDDMRIWNTERTAAQINNFRNCELVGNESGLVAYYKFNQGFDQSNNGTVTSLINSVSGTGNGSLNNFSLTGTTSNWASAHPLTPHSSISLNETACGSYFWSLNGQTYTTSGVYTSTSNCITTTLNLTVNPSTVYYADLDNDGYGNLQNTQTSCSPLQGYVSNSLDCDDSNAANYPGAVDVCYDGIDNDCNGNIDNIGMPGGCIPIYTTPSTNVANSTVTYGSAILTSLVPNCQGYRFRVTRVDPINDTPISSPVIVDMGLRNLFIASLSNYAYGAKYSIETTVRINNVWQPNYAPAFYVYTPVPVSTMNSCGTQISTKSTQISSSSVSQVTAYRYQVQRLDASNAIVSTQEVTSGSRYFTFDQVSDFIFDANYSVSCAIRNLDGVFMAYGPACTIQAPKHPTSEVRAAQCNDYAVTSYNENIGATLVRNAIQYRYRLNNVAQGYDYSVDRSANYFRLTDFPGLVPGETYSVQVAVSMPGQPDFGPFSKTCTIIVPGGVSRTTEEASSVTDVRFEATVYPNPFAEHFYFKVNSASTIDYTIQVYDMLGRVVETKTVSSDSVESTEVGANFPAGVYNVIITQGENSKVLRVVKR